MSELVRTVYEYRTLIGRRDALRMRLTEEEKVRLEELEQRFEWAPDEAGELVGFRRRFARCDVKLRARIKVAGTFVRAILVNVGGGGMVVQPALPLRKGELTVVRVVEESSGREYHFPVQAVWRSEGLKRSTLGLSFVGIPLEIRKGASNNGTKKAA